MMLCGLNYKKIYFIGIGGISMSALAEFLHAQRYQVCGSDAHESEETEHLRACGVRVYIGADGNRSELWDCDLVVYTDAIPLEHTERVKAQRLGKQMLSRTQLLQCISNNFAHTIAVAGSHGKTTCSAMCAHVLLSVGVPFTAHIGGHDTALGNYHTTGMEYFLTEACEYNKNITKLFTESAVILNIDNDHMECYGDEETLIDCFKSFARQSKTTFVCADDLRCLSLGDFPTFSIQNASADYRAVNLRAQNEKYSFTIEEYGKALCRVRLQAVGRCNVYNALAAFAVMRSQGFHEQEIVRGLQNFTSVKRRFEKIGTFLGASIICDYAHHPREISATIKTARNVCRGKLFVVFQPHTYSRTKLLFQDFVKVLSGIENIIVYKTYPAREKYDELGSAERLVGAMPNALYVDNVYALKTWLKTTVKEGDLVLFLGAGDIYYVAQYILKEV